jgi:EamA domain-containing membrane protein RarD
MDELLYWLARDFPSTAILLAFGWGVYHHISAALALLDKHLTETLQLLRDCMESDKTVAKE